MKKLLITLLVIVVIISASVMTVSAANYEYCAEELSNLGLLKGTDAGFDLDRAPTRAEALIMLIRLYGLEDEALAGEYETPFTDVPDWASKYVGYAYENGLTSGTSATTFGSAGNCSAQMYVTFVLRALGYSDADNGDFTYAKAIDFGKSVSVVDDLLAEGTFLRDQMAAISYLALSAQPKDGEFETLLGKLESDGAVSAESAKTVLDKIALYDEFMAVNSSLNNETSLSMTGTMDMEMSVMGTVTAIGLDMDMSMILKDNDILASILMDIDMDGESLPLECYISEGNVYINMLGEKMRMDMGLEDVMSLADASDTSTSVNPIYTIKDIKKATEGSLTVYTVEFSEGFFNAAIEQAMAMVGVAGLEDAGLSGMSIGGVELKLYADASGALKKIAMAMDASIAITAEGSSLTVPVSVDMEFEIKAVGSAVKVTLPNDLKDYVEADLAE